MQEIMADAGKEKRLTVVHPGPTAAAAFPAPGRRGWKRTLRALVASSPLPFLIREVVQRRCITILLYHDPEPELFARHLGRLSARYNLVPLRRVVDVLEGKQQGLPPKPLVVTIDDGLKGNFALLPTIRRLGAPVTLFACSGIVGTQRGFWFNSEAYSPHLKLLPDGERLRELADAGFDQDRDQLIPEALSREELAATAEVVDVQAHSATHPTLPACSDEKAGEEIAGAKRMLERDYGLDVYAIAFPNGDYGEREVELAREAGYRAALTVDWGFNRHSSDPFRLRRLTVDDTCSEDELLVHACGLGALLRRAAALARPSRENGIVR